MKITVFNIKGGQGKTTISLALATLYGFYVITNDEFSPIDSMLDSEKAIHLAQDGGLPTWPNRGLIYDFSGYPDELVINAVNTSRWVIIPVSYRSPLDMQTTLSTIEEIEQYNNNILLVANQTRPDSFESTYAILRSHYDYPIFEIKDSMAFVRMVEEKQSIEQLIAKKFLYSHHFEKPLEQVEALGIHILMG